MAATLLQSLTALPSDPRQVLDLYSQLYAASFLVPVQTGSEADLLTARFLTYATNDGVRELPIFTAERFLLKDLVADAVFAHAAGDLLWPRMLDIVVDDECQVAVDPLQSHSIRLTRAMILGMVAEYAA